MGHIEPCLAQLTILSAVANAYSTPFLGCSSEAWFEFATARVQASEALTEGTPPAASLEGAASDNCVVLDSDRR